MRIITAREQVEMLAPWREAAFNKKLVDQLHGEFREWWGDGSNPPHPGREYQWGVKDEPLSYWKNIESFLKDRYPEAHGNLIGGMEDAYPRLEDPAWKEETWGKSSPERTQSLGYDPAEIASGMLVLHNGSQPGREEWTEDDLGLMTRIFQKRQQMQRNYEQRQVSA